MKITCSGVVTLIDPDPSAGIKRDKHGRFYEIPHSLADRIIKDEPADKPIYLMHKEGWKIGRIKRMRKDKRKIKNKNRDVLVADFDILSKPFIQALKESSAFFYNEIKEERFTSSDNFIPGHTGKCGDIDLTAKHAIMRKYPELSIGHTPNGDVVEVSLCTAGARNGALITDVTFEENGGDGKFEDENSYEDYFKFMASQYVIGNWIMASKVEKDLKAAGQSLEPLQYVMEGCNKCDCGCKNDISEEPEGEAIVAKPEQPAKKSIVMAESIETLSKQLQESSHNRTSELLKEALLLGQAAERVKQGTATKAKKSKSRKRVIAYSSSDESSSDSEPEGRPRRGRKRRYKKAGGGGRRYAPHSDSEDDHPRGRKKWSARYDEPPTHGYPQYQPPQPFYYQPPQEVKRPYQPPPPPQYQPPYYHPQGGYYPAPTHYPGVYHPVSPTQPKAPPPRNAAPSHAHVVTEMEIDEPVVEEPRKEKKKKQKSSREPPKEEEQPPPPGADGDNDNAGPSGLYRYQQTAPAQSLKEHFKQGIAELYQKEGGVMYK